MPPGPKGSTRAISPGLAARMHRFQGAGDAEQYERKHSARRQPSPRRAISPRLRELCLAQLAPRSASPVPFCHRARIRLLAPPARTQPLGPVLHAWQSTYTAYGMGYGLLVYDFVERFLLHYFGMSAHTYTRGTRRGLKPSEEYALQGEKVDVQCSRASSPSCIKEAAQSLINNKANESKIEVSN